MLILNYDASDLHRVMQERGVTLYEARQHIERTALKRALEQATTVDDMRSVLTFVVDKLWSP